MVERRTLPHSPFWVSDRLARHLAYLLGSLLLLAARVDINLFSLSAFYRNRLVRCYLGATRSPDERTPQNFTGFDGQDDLKLVDLNAEQQQKKKKEPPEGPFHVVNCALNLGGSSDLALHAPQRRVHDDSFRLRKRVSL